MLKEFRQAIFDECLHSEFQIIENETTMCTLELAEIVERMKTPEQETFSLLFRGPLIPFVPQGIRRLRHSSLGDLNVFLVPISQQKDGFQYEAVFNKLLKPRE